MLAVPAFVFLVGVAIAVVKWVAVRAEREIAKAQEQANLAHEAKEKLRAEFDAKLEEARKREEEKEDEIQAELRKALDFAYSSRFKTPARDKPPAPTAPPRAKRSTSELLQEVREVTTGRFRREDLVDDMP